MGRQRKLTMHIPHDNLLIGRFGTGDTATVDTMTDQTKDGTMLKEFREFDVRGNVVDMAVGIIIGAAFTSVVNSLVTDIIAPPIGLLLGNFDFGNLFIMLRAGKVGAPYNSLAAAKAAGAVTFNYGLFINALISFIIVSFAIFFLVRNINRLRKRVEAAASPTTKECPYCLSVIPLKAVRCAHCTSGLKTS
jgi:large conductance mechanosensitive channel